RLAFFYGTLEEISFINKSIIYRMIKQIGVITMEVSKKYELIKTSIEDACRNVNRNPEEVTVIAVTKYVSIDRAKEAVEAGIIHLGENRDEGLTTKWNSLGDGHVWHFIGTLQSRKVKNIIDKVSYIHSLDRLSLAKEINK